MTSSKLHEASASGSYRLAGWAAIASGVIGIIAFGSLIAYLATTPSEVLESKVALEPGAIPLLSRLFLSSSDVGFILQSLLMIPVALAIHAYGRQRSPAVSLAAVTVAIIALGGVALLRFLTVVNPDVSGILFMGPTGFIGAWLIVVNWLLASVLSRGLRTTGTVAGVGLIIQSASFFFLGGLIVLTAGPEAYADDVDFHNWNAIGGVPGSILFAIWAILLGSKLLRARVPSRLSFASST